MYDEKYFERVAGRCGGRVTFIGRRLEPGLIRKLLLYGGGDKEFLKESYELTDEQVEAALKFDDSMNDYGSIKIGWKLRTLALLAIFCVTAGAILVGYGIYGSSINAFMSGIALVIICYCIYTLMVYLANRDKDT